MKEVRITEDYEYKNVEEHNNIDSLTRINIKIECNSRKIIQVQYKLFKINALLLWQKLVENCSTKSLLR